MKELLISSHTLVVFILTLRVLYRDELTGSARLAWFIAFTTLPGVGLVIYLLFGEVHISSKLVERHRLTIEQGQHLAPEIFGDPDIPLDEVAIQHRDTFQYVHSINGFAPMRGNRIELLKDSADFKQRLLADIDAAEGEISILYYIWLADQTGTEVTQALIRAATRGVKCRVMVDQLGSRKFIRSNLWSDMKAAGVECRISMPFERLSRIRIINRFDLRNHRKITVIDGRIAYCGSQNCADPEFHHKAKYAPWVDIMTRVTGPTVNQMQAIFVADWVAAEGKATIGDFAFAGTPEENGVLAQVRGTGPLKRQFSATQSVGAAIHSARRDLMITTPYFVPDLSVLYALCKAAYSGVEVTLNLPARNDSRIVSAASRSHYLVLLDAGVRIFEYQPGLLHAKIMTIDGVFSIIGSSNLDLRSFDLNYENDLLIYSAETTEEIRMRQQEYLSASVEIKRDTVAAWSAPRRMYYNVIATMGPIL